MFKKKKCAGCRKMKYFVKHREVIGLPTQDTLTSMDQFCFWCGRKLNKIIKKMNNG